VYVAELCFPGAGSSDPDVVSHKVNGLLGALRMNGQVCGREWPIAIRGQNGVTIVLLPDLDALDSSHANQYVQGAIAEFRDAGLSDPTITIMGEDADSAPPCICPTVGSYILFTNYLSLEPPLRCGNCFNPVPLYKIPHTYHGEYYDIICWQSDYQACDTLQMNSSTLERATVRELSRADSSLSQRGIEICTKISHATGIPVYYYLYRYSARSKKQERERLCPSCGGAWLLQTPWHLFDFKCDRCRVLSNIAWDIR
jgi:predicted  nucleic acid-binding Zn ribbon protein